MAALTVERKTPKLSQEVLSSFPSSTGVNVEAGAKIYAGAIVCKNAAGNAVPASSALNLVALGMAEKTVDNSAGIAGALIISPRSGVFKYNNSASVDLIAAANVGSDCFLVDDNTVALTHAGLTRSRAGVVWSVDPDGVFVLLALTATAVGTLPSAIQSGTATLVAGTVVISSGISITAASRVLLTYKTIGGTAGNLSAPAASRTVGAPGVASLTLLSSSVSDTSTVDYVIIG